MGRVVTGEATVLLQQLYVLHISKIKQALQVQDNIGILTATHLRAMACARHRQYFQLCRVQHLTHHSAAFVTRTSRCELD